MNHIRLALGLAVCAVFVSGCGSSTNADAGAPTSAVGGTIAGKLLTGDGRPIEKASVSYDGWPEGAIGTMVNGRINSPANGHVEAKDGRYEIKLPPGQYTTEATAIVKWHDKDYTFKLETADGSDDTARAGVSADKGVSRDYVWKMTGTRRGRDPNYVGSGWDRALYGATLEPNLGEFDTDNYQPSGPVLTAADKDASLEFTLVPKGKLIDGSDGKTLVEKLPVAKSGQSGFGVRGIPVGDYTVTARLVKADGSSEPLRLSLTGSAWVEGSGGTKTRVPWRPSLDVIFEPETGVMANYGVQILKIYVGK